MTTEVHTYAYFVREMFYLFHCAKTDLTISGILEDIARHADLRRALI